MTKKRGTKSYKRGDKRRPKTACAKQVRKIDRRKKGPGGKTAGGKTVRNPRAYVYGGMRKHGWKPSTQKRGKKKRR